MTSLLFEKISKIKSLFFYGILVGLIFIILAIFNKALAIGLFLIILLTAITFLITWKAGIKNKDFYYLLLIVFLIHLAAVLFIHYYHFYPFGGQEGDQQLYHQIAVELAERFRQGSFSIEGFNNLYPDLYVSHIYPIFIGVLYTLTIPELLVGQLLNVWFVVISILFLYLLVIEIGNSRKNAFFIGLITGLWPSYLYASSLLLREAIVLFLCFFSLLLLVKIIKNFTWKNFLIFLITTGILISFRFYLGYVLILTFAFCWPLVNLNLKKKIIYGIIVLVLVGFLPQFFADQGYYGTDSFKTFFNLQTINYIQERYFGGPEPQSKLPEPSDFFQNNSMTAAKKDLNDPFIFLKNYFKSFIFVFVGPFPWHITLLRHFLVFTETIPWYFLLFFIIKGILSLKDYKKSLPIIIFSIGTFLVLSLFINTNFGTYMRLRVPAYIALLALADFTSINNNKFVKKIQAFLHARFIK